MTEEEIEALKQKEIAKKIMLGKDSDKEKMDNAIKVYKKTLSGLEKIRESLNITPENSAEFEYFPKITANKVEGFSPQDLCRVNLKMKNLAKKYIKDFFVEDWTKAIKMAYEGTGEAEARINHMNALIEIEPFDTFDAMSISYAFITRLDSTSKADHYKYVNTLNGIKKFCASVSNADKVLNLMDLVIYSKYEGVVDAVKNGIKRNPNTKSLDNVESYFRTVEEAKLKRVFPERESE